MQTKVTINQTTELVKPTFEKYSYGCDFQNISQARAYLKQNQNAYQNRKVLRKFFMTDWWKSQKGNFEIVMDFILNVIHDSKEGFCSMSRDTISRHTGIPEKTVEYQIQKAIKIKLLKLHTIPSRRNTFNKSKILQFNISFNPNAKKEKLGKLKSITYTTTKLQEAKKNTKKNVAKKLRPQNIFTDKQIDAGLLAGLKKRDFFRMDTLLQALSLLMGSHGLKFDVLPCQKKKLQLNKYGLNYEELDLTGKVMYLINHFEDTKHAGIMIRVPEGYVLIDADSTETGEKLLMENYHGGFIIKTPRGLKVLCRLPQSYEINFNIKDVEFHLAGRHDCVLGTGYKILSMLEPSEFDSEWFNNFEKSEIRLKKSVDISEVTGKIEVGFRNDFLFRKGRSLKCKGVDDYSSLFEILSAINRENFDKPLPLHEVDDLTRHCLKYRNRLDFYYAA